MPQLCSTIPTRARRSAVARRRVVAEHATPCRRVRAAVALEDLDGGRLARPRWARAGRTPRRGATSKSMPRTASCAVVGLAQARAPRSRSPARSIMATSPPRECSAPASTSAPTRRACWSPSVADGRLTRGAAAARVHPPRQGPARAARSRARRSPRSRASSPSSARSSTRARRVALRVVATAAIRGAANGAEFTRRAARRRRRRRRGARRRGGGAAGVPRAPRARSGEPLAGQRRRGRRRRRLDRDRDRHARRRRRRGASRSASAPASWPTRYLALATRPRPPSCTPMREHAARRLRGRSTLPPVDAAVAVGGSAASLRRLVGAALDARLAATRAAGAGRRPGGRRGAAFLDRPRAGAADARRAAWCSTPPRTALGRPLQIGRGGLREGVLLELAGT